MAPSRVWVMHAFALVYHSPTNPPPPAIEFRFVTTSSPSTTTMIRLRTKTANSRIEWCHRRLPSAKPACVWWPGASASGSGEVRSENITRHRGAVAVSKFGTPRGVFSRVPSGPSANTSKERHLPSTNVVDGSLPKSTLFLGGWQQFTRELGFMALCNQRNGLVIWCRNPVNFRFSRSAGAAGRHT